MNNFFMFAAHNTVVTLLLALVVYGLTRVWRNPPVAHALWLLVLLKLVSPPVLRVDWSRLPGSTQGDSQIIADLSRIEEQQPESHAHGIGRGQSAWEQGDEPRNRVRLRSPSG